MLRGRLEGPGPFPKVMIPPEGHDPVPEGEVLLTSDRWDQIARRLEFDDAPTAGGRVCSVARELLGAATVGILLELGEARVPVDGVDEWGEALDEAQLLSGEGPTVEAIAAVEPIMLDDVASAGAFARWPGSVARLAEGGIAAVFAFPMRVGGVRVGVLTAYRTSSGPLDHAQFTDGIVIASLATLLLMVDGPGDAAAVGILGENLESNSRLMIAAGIVAEQIDITVADALVRIRAHAYTAGARLDDVVRAVIDQTLVLEP